MTGKIVKLLEEKRKIIRELGEIIGKKRVEKVAKDHHARRKPRHCGITILKGVGCSYGFAHCYL